MTSDQIDEVKTQKAPLSGEEFAAIMHILFLAKRHGYSNMIEWIQVAWAVSLRDEEGFSEDEAITASAVRPYFPMPHKPASSRCACK